MTKRRVQKYPQDIKNQFHVKQIQPKTMAQQLYMESLTDATITIGLGPAGTGKSYVSTYVAMKKLMNNEVSKVILTRPVVESGESLGFLPGTLEEKVHPYLLPLLDSLADHIGPMMLQKLMEEKRIEFAPLAYLRGRTFKNCFVILDEAQNTNIDQMKMFITRLGDGCQMVIDGDPSQSDLPSRDRNGKRIDSGLKWIVRKLRHCDDSIQICEFRKPDIVRHPLLTKIIDRLESDDGDENPVRSSPSAELIGDLPTPRVNGRNPEKGMLLKSPGVWVSECDNPLFNK